MPDDRDTTTGSDRAAPRPAATGETGGTSSACPKLVVETANNIKERPLEWLWPGRIPLGKITLLGGDAGLGKSLLTVDIAARVSTGRAWPDRPDDPMREPGRVLIVTAEDDPEDTLVPRLRVAGPDLTRIDVERGVQETDHGGTKCLALDAHTSAIGRYLRDHPDTRLITVDPISAYMGRVDAHKNAEVRGVLSLLAEVAAATHVAVLCLTHFNKSVNTPKALYRMMDSIAFGAIARAVFGVFPERDDERRLFLCVKMNLALKPHGLAYRIKEAEPGIPVIDWDLAPVETTADDALAARRRRRNARRLSNKQKGCYGSYLQMAGCRQGQLKRKPAKLAFQSRR